MVANSEGVFLRHCLRLAAGQLWEGERGGAGRICVQIPQTQTMMVLFSSNLVVAVLMAAISFKGDDHNFYET